LMPELLDALNQPSISPKDWKLSQTSK
jgi:hypothetical protein